MTDEQREQIEAMLSELDNPNSETRKRFDALGKKYDEMARPLLEAIDASTRLTERDYQLRINY